MTPVEQLHDFQTKLDQLIAAHIGFIAGNLKGVFAMGDVLVRAGMGSRQAALDYGLPAEEALKALDDADAADKMFAEELKKGMV